MIPSDPDQIYRIADSMGGEEGEKYLQQALQEYQRIYGREENTPSQPRSPGSLYDEIYKQESHPYSPSSSMQQPSQSPSRWQEFRNALPYYGAAVPFLGGGLMGLLYGLRGNKKKRGDE
jgi:hypothetical protein